MYLLKTQEVVTQMEQTGEIKFDVKMTTGLMYDFLLYHTYTSVAGLISTLLGILLVGFGLNLQNQGTTNPLIYYIAGGILIIYMPINLWLSAQRQVKLSPIYKEPITYTLCEEGIVTAQNEEEAKAEWSAVQKVVSTGRSIIVYTAKNRGVILEKKAMGNSYQNVLKMISTHVEPKKV